MTQISQSKMLMFWMKGVVLNNSLADCCFWEEGSVSQIDLRDQIRDKIKEVDFHWLSRRENDRYRER